MSNINYLSISTDGSTTSVLRDLGFIKNPLPFDWVNTTIKSIELCFKYNFYNYHDNITRTDVDNTHVIDEYGFIFKYDYPVDTNNIINNQITDYNQNILDTVIKNNKINEIVIEKYKKRIEHFNALMNSPVPIICLCNYDPKDVIKLQELFITYYNRNNINLYIINISLSPPLYDNLYIPPNIYNVNLNKTNIYMWKYMIDLVLRHHDKQTYDAHNKPQLPDTNDTML